MWCLVTYQGQLCLYLYKHTHTHTHTHTHIYIYIYISIHEALVKEMTPTYEPFKTQNPHVLYHSITLHYAHKKYLWLSYNSHNTKKLKLSDYTPLRRLGERRYSSYSFSTSALDGGQWSASRLSSALAPRKGPPVHVVKEYGWTPPPHSRSGHRG
jgi:hypothetical protein